MTGKGNIEQVRIRHSREGGSPVKSIGWMPAYAGMTTYSVFPKAPLRIFLHASLAVLLLVLAGCGGVKYTVDDGRQVDEKLLSNIRALGNGEQAIRPALLQSVSLRDKECDTQWELPFAVATSYDLKEDDRVAWARGLQVDERLTVIGAAPEIGLDLGEKIAEIAGYHRDNSFKMLEELLERRDSGKSFQVKTADGKITHIFPIKVCRGHIMLATPDTPETQDYHWRQSVHPLEAFSKPLTPDEAMWVVLWTQGLSEEGGVRMKTYQYGMSTLKTIVNVAAVVSGVGAAANAAQAAGASVASAAGNAAARAAAEAAAKQLAQEAQRSIAKDLTDRAYKLARKELGDVLQAAAANRIGLGGVSWVAGTVFDRADKWAFEHMAKLNADPLAAFTLHMKLADAGATHNAFVFDEERLTQMKTLAATAGLSEKVARLLDGKPAEPATEIATTNATTTTDEDNASIQALSADPDEIKIKELSQIAEITPSELPETKTTEKAIQPVAQPALVETKPLDTATVKVDANTALQSTTAMPRQSQAEESAEARTLLSRQQLETQ